ncbi:oleate delta-12 desaturase [Ascobolus immersus RN42]|uniref:Oleate delta-12 desaturase n=1 Tax=Ascobolus immersus RN42 TaxID=1160509 RepID=A0A3N4IDM5_ASCIM|nr:oleate delta-12 desaturase [Ascobolus immersus RN42]
MSPTTRSRKRGDSVSTRPGAVSTGSSLSISTAESSDANTASPSPTSASSVTSISDNEATTKKGKPLLDTYGNEFKIPDFTIKEIRDAIPAHCFERSYLTSMLYVARDVFYILTLFYLANTYIPLIPSKAGRFVAYAAYTFVQGLVGTGLWVLAHECGHGAFSPSKTVNDFMGWWMHSALLVPYYSWKISHSKHHKATGHMERDMVFVPKTRIQKFEAYGKQFGELVEETPISALFNLFLQQLFGWPMYLLTNVTGHNFHERQSEGRGKGKSNGWFGGVNHFDPRSPLYESKDAHLILYSDLGIAITGYLLYLAVQKFGGWNVMVFYGIPYLWVNHWLVAITYLQHTDPTLPHYHPETWTYTRGAAATIDREFGFIGRHIFHGIIETHVAHHFISSIPFYHADEATEAIKKVMGEHYRSDTKGGPWGFIRALFTAPRVCQFVEESEGAEGEGKGVVFFRNANGIGPKPRDLKDVIDRRNVKVPNASVVEEH